MNRKGRYLRIFSWCSAVMMLWMCVPVHAVFAAMVDTESVLQAPSIQDSRHRILTFLERQDVQAALVSQGVDPAEAKARVNSLSDAEVMEINDKLDQLPAGGSAFAALLGVALVIFLILLITDLLGLTDVFPFVRR